MLLLNQIKTDDTKELFKFYEFLWKEKYKFLKLKQFSHEVPLLPKKDTVFMGKHILILSSSSGNREII